MANTFGHQHRVYILDMDGREVDVYRGNDSQRAHNLNSELCQVFVRFFGLNNIGKPGVPSACIINADIFEDCGCSNEKVDPEYAREHMHSSKPASPTKE